MPRILGLETSCDETAAAVVADGRRIESNVVWSQHSLHAAFRGVVPEIASRAHLERLWPVVQQALTEAGVSLDQVEAIAVGNRPGLIGSLIVGVSAAKALAWALDKPLIGVDHVQAHLYAPALHSRGEAERASPTDADVPGHASSRSSSAPAYAHPPSAMDHSPSPLPCPALGLVVSGGHTSLYHIAGPGELHRLGGTIDDAVGEAFDKAAAILEAGYPGGPAIERLAAAGDAGAYALPRSLLDRESLDFSFSGLKTALLYTVCGRPQGRGRDARFERAAADLTDQQRADLAASFQAAAIETLVIKVRRAIEQWQMVNTPRTDRAQSVYETEPTMDETPLANEPLRSLVVGGGVAANALLRTRLQHLAAEQGLPLHVAPAALCVDNAAMIAGLAHHALAAGRVDELDLPALASGG